MGFLDPFAVDGATITAAQLRQAYYEAVKGFSGVAEADHLRVVGVAGSPGVVGIMPGVGSIAVPSRREAYQVSNPAMDGDALLSVPVAGSGGATWYVVVEVADPQYHGTTPAALPRLASSLAGLTRPYLPLARFHLPAGGQFSTSTPVIDMREVSNPATHLAAWSVRPTSATQSSTSTGWQDWVRLAASTTVPDWAGRVQLQLAVAGAVVRTGLWHGQVRVAFKVGGGVLATEGVSVREDPTGLPGNADRFSLPFGDLIAVPEIRTGAAEVWLQTSRDEGTGRIEVNAGSTVSLSATYIQAAR